jgi:hypothetical protein
MSGVALVDSAHKDDQDYPHFPHGKTLGTTSPRPPSPERTLRMPAGPEVARLVRDWVARL